MDELEDLFKPKTGAENTWYEGLTSEQQAWVDTLAAKAKELGKLPVGNRSAEAFARAFGGKAPVGSTIRATVKRLNADG